VIILEKKKSILFAVLLCLICVSLMFVTMRDNPSYRGALAYQVKRSQDEVFLEIPINLKNGHHGSFFNESEMKYYILTTHDISNSTPYILEVNYSPQSFEQNRTNIFEIPYHFIERCYFTSLGFYNASFYWMDASDYWQSNYYSLFKFSPINNSLSNRSLPLPLDLSDYFTFNSSDYFVEYQFINIWNKTIWFHEYITITPNITYYKTVSYITGISYNTLEVVKRIEISPTGYVYQIDNGTVWVQIDANELGGIGHILVGYSLTTNELSKIIRGVFSGPEHVNDPNLGEGQKVTLALAIFRNNLVISYHLRSYLYSFEFFNISLFDQTGVLITLITSSIGMCVGLGIMVYVIALHWFKKDTSSLVG
jgi:hypothetical protein